MKAGPTIHLAPYHWHKYHLETFLVHSGTMRATVEGRDHFIQPGNSVAIEPGQYHTFHNGGKEGEELVMSVGLDPAERERDETFFRNVCSYADDCRKQGRELQVPQMCLFLWFFDVYLALPGPKWVARPLSQVLVFVVGVVVGKWLLAYKESYEEYSKQNTE